MFASLESSLYASPDWGVYMPFTKSRRPGRKTFAKGDFMKISKLLTAVVLPALAASAWAEGPNPAVDMSGHLRISGEAARHRRHRLVSEDTFIRMSRQPGTVVLDARSSERYG